MKHLLPYWWRRSHYLSAVLRMAQHGLYTSTLLSTPMQLVDSGEAHDTFLKSIILKQTACHTPSPKPSPNPLDDQHIVLFNWGLLRSPHTYENGIIISFIYIFIWYTHILYMYSALFVRDAIIHRGL